MELTVPADDKQLETVLDFIHKQLPADCETDLMYKIDVAAEEIFVNIAHYGYKDKLPVGQTGTVWLTCTFENDLLCMIFRDKGIPFRDMFSLTELVALYDYLDRDDRPISLVLPTVERVPMVVGISPKETRIS